VTFSDSRNLYVSLTFTSTSGVTECAPVGSFRETDSRARSGAVATLGNVPRSPRRARSFVTTDGLVARGSLVIILAPHPCRQSLGRRPLRPCPARHSSSVDRSSSLAILPKWQVASFGHVPAAPQAPASVTIPMTVLPVSRMIATQSPSARAAGSFPGRCARESLRLPGG
jgi:hypothetical protein